VGGISGQKRQAVHAQELAAIGEREAQQTILAGQFEAQRIVLEGKKQVGVAIARSGAAGLQLRGSVLDSIASSYANIEMDRLNTIYNSQREAQLIRERARAQSQATKAEGRATLTRSLGGAAMTLAQSGLFSSQDVID
jgi:hypothetical protein